MPTDAQLAHYARLGGWNKGQSYVIDKGRPYANQNGWRLALRRVYGDTCMNCGWNAAYVDAHHIVPKSEGGPLTIDNGVLLCPNCHRLAHVGKLIHLEAIKALAKPLVVTR